MIKLAVIIPVFNTLNYTKKCLQYLTTYQHQVNPEKMKLSIIVTDDGSTDGTSDWIRQNYPQIELCKGDGNLWWSGGVNMGVKHALDNLNCDYILLWNNDIRPTEDYFSKLSDILNNNTNDQIILSCIYAENNSENIIFSRGGNFNEKTGRHRLIGIGSKEKEYTHQGLTINWFPGMGTVIHKVVFERIGYFDEKYFPQYKGDSDFALRAYKAGFKLVLQEELKIWNDRSNTGFSNDKTWKEFFKSLTSIKSNANIYRDILFYRRHATSVKAYFELLRKYSGHIGGFIKWKLLGLIGLKRKRKY